MHSILLATVGSASASLLRVHINHTDSALHVPGMANYGNKKCPCVGFDNVDGTTDVNIDGHTVAYPADLGARCQAWDESTAPECKGANPPSWCQDSWCYVDPCKCDLPDVPKISAYLPDSEYQGKPVYYHYGTCGSSDHYTEEYHKSACVNQKAKDSCNSNKKCLWNDKLGKCAGSAITGYCMKPLPVNKHGENTCRCVGIDNQPGTTKVNAGGQVLDYPADIGATCDAWDMDRHPECKGDKKESWCYDRWCYVDPCSCDHEVPPKSSDYLPESSFQGKPVFFSYATCGTEDRYTEKHSKKEQQAVCDSAWMTGPLATLFVLLVKL